MLGITIVKQHKYRKRKKRHEPSLLQTTGEDEPNKNEDIKFSAHDAFLEWSPSGTLKIEILENQII